MLTKIVFTLAVVALAYLAIRSRSRAVVAKEAAAPQGASTKTVSPRVVAYVFLVVAVATGSTLFVLEWYDARQVITIRVINSRTGEAVVYEAEKGKVHGRRFETLDGRVVTVADVDRVEVEED